MPIDKKITSWLSKTNRIAFVVFVIMAAFMTYSSMYAFRKPFAAATYGDVFFFGIHIKIWLITAQVIGYTLSKFIGIKVVPEMPNNKRAVTIVILVLMAEVSLLLFALINSPVRIVFMFFNGLPLGIIWGVVFSYLEGRRVTELLGAGLSVSFIFASGAVKSVGKWLILHFEVSDYWMPFLTGAIFLIPLLASVWLLNCVPDPDETDIKLRTQRKQMPKQSRVAFFKEFATVIVLFIITYSFLTIFREMRDNFAAEIWNSLGFSDDPAIFTLSEIPVGLGSLLCMAIVTFIIDNGKALKVIQYMIIAGFAIIGIATFLFQVNFINGVWWMIIIGFGLYLAYIPFNALLFERMIAAFKYVSTIGYIMYLADSFGYLSSIIVFLVKNFFNPGLSWLKFFQAAGYNLSIAGVLLSIITMVILNRKHKKRIESLPQ